MIYLILFFITLFILFIITKKVTFELFLLLRKFLKNEKIIFALVSIVYLPGTILHELSHMIAAALLLLKVKSISLLPLLEEKKIQLGSVVFEKKDFVRGFLVGIAPIFTGLAFLFFIFNQRLVSSDNLIQNVLFIYLIFAVSSTMFSSKQDLVDFVYFIPFFVLVAFLFYFLQIDIHLIIKNEKLVGDMVKFFKEIDLYLFFGALVNFTLLIILRVINKF